jgi:addiction module HigA family antidote
LGNVHPGDVLRHDFLVGSEIPLSEVSAGAGIDSARLRALLNGEISVDADIDLRLARYFGLSEGVLLGLQNDYDIEEAKRALNGKLDRIVPRAA